MTGPDTEPTDEHRFLRDEIRGARIAWVDTYVEQRINRRNGAATAAQVEAWESEAVRIWNERHPAMLAFAFYPAAPAPTEEDRP